jgi:hypothetical protein
MEIQKPLSCSQLVVCMSSSLRLTQCLILKCFTKQLFTLHSRALQENITSGLLRQERSYE